MICRTACACHSDMRIMAVQMHHGSHVLTAFTMADHSQFVLQFVKPGKRTNFAKIYILNFKSVNI